MSPGLLNPSLFGPGGGPPPTDYAASVLSRGSLMAYYRVSEVGAPFSTMADSGPGGNDGIYRTIKNFTPSLLSSDPGDSAIESCPGDASGSWLNVTEISAECLIKTPSSIGGNQGIFTRFGGSAHCWIVWINLSNQIAARFYNTSGAQVDLAWTPAASTEYHLVAQYTSGLAELIIDGTVEDSSAALTGDLQTGTQDVEVMAYNGGAFGFTGIGDEFALYSSPLTLTEIADDIALM